MFFCQSSAAAQGLAVLTILLVWWMIMITFPILRAHLFPWGVPGLSRSSFWWGIPAGPGLLPPLDPPYWQWFCFLLRSPEIFKVIGQCSIKYCCLLGRAKIFGIDCLNHISPHSYSISPGSQNGYKVGCPARLFKVIWCPTSEPFWARWKSFELVRNC